MAVAPGTNMPAKKWYLDKFKDCVRRIISEFDVLPMVVGGPNEMEDAMYLVDSWGCGAIAISQFSIKETVALLARCSLFIGNDTGAQHLAAGVGVPCVTVFSARDNPERWEPYGFNHKVIRHDPDCVGCMLSECPDKPSCLDTIEVEEVYHVCRKKLEDMKNLKLSV